MKDIVKAFDNLPWIIKLILCIPMLDIVWAVYRIIHGVAYNKVLNIVLGILWIIPGSVICWLLDLIFVILGKNVFKF